MEKGLKYMKICFFALREFDELQYCEKYKKEMGIDFVYTAEYPSLENVTIANGCEAISTTPCDLSAPILEALHAQGVKYITCRSIGYDHVDLAKAKELGMRVSNVSYPPQGVADYAIMFMLMCIRRFAHVLKRVEVQDYTLKNKIGRNLSGCTVGVLGTGKIGATVIKQLSGFGCKIYAYDKYQNPEVLPYAEYADLDTVLTNCDILTLHMNANEENYHLISKETIAKMKKGVVIINTARGKLIDSDALIEGIECGKVGGAALDVLENENGLYYYNRMGEAMENRQMAVLRSFPNVILSPHTAFYTEENIDDMVFGCFDGFRAMANGEDSYREIKF